MGWVHETRLPHLLAPERYHAPEIHAVEIEKLFAPAWHCVGTLDDMPAHGDFLTTDLFGTPLLVRNHQGELRAFLNVCAHRHCLLSHAPRGSSPRLECQYHGWQYDGAGRLACMPDAKSFVRPRGEESGTPALRRHQLATLGRLVFVSLAEAPPPLVDWLGPTTSDRIRAHFSSSYRQVAARRLEHPANWKVPIENSLESYHVPRLHPKTFKVLVPASDIHHELGDRYTTHEDVEQGSSAAYRWLMRRMRRRPTYTYVHHHAFPNLTFACTDVTSVLQVVVPISPTKSYSIVRAFVHGGDAGSLPERAIASIMKAPVVRFMDTVMAEDAVIFPDLQRGLESSVHQGAIGAREERVWAFQRWVDESVRAGRETSSTHARERQPRLTAT